jgi:hypothetical protein
MIAVLVPRTALSAAHEAKTAIMNSAEPSNPAPGTRTRPLAVTAYPPGHARNTARRSRYAVIEAYSASACRYQPQAVDLPQRQAVRLS